MSSGFKFHELPEFDIAKLQNEWQQKYQPYGLKKNPFPMSGSVPTGSLEYTYLKDLDRRKIFRYVTNTFLQAEFNGLLVLGEYGSGKSHILNYIADFINRDPESAFGGYAKAFLIQNPGLAPEDIILSMLRAINLGEIQELIFYPVVKKFRELYDDSTTDFLKKYTSYGTKKTSSLQGSLIDPEDAKDVPPSFRFFSEGYRDFTKKMDSWNVKLKTNELRMFAREVLVERSIQDSIADSFAGLLFGDESKDPSSWESFLLDNLTGGAKYRIGIEYYLEGILQLFEIMGLRHIYLLVDEFEDLRTQRLRPAAATEYLAALRRMIQHNATRFSFILASARDAWKDLNQWYPAFGDRFPETIELSSNPASIKPMVAYYLKMARLDDQELTFHPFTEDAVDHLLTLVEPTPRNVLRAAYRVIEEGLDTGESAPLSSNFVQNSYR